MNDLLSKGDKIYYIDFEDSKASYTVLEIRNAKPGSFVKGGPYYYVHSDNLSNATGYYPIFVEEVDKEGGRGRFFSTPKKAHEAYEKFKINVAKKKTLQEDTI